MDEISLHFPFAGIDVSQAVGKQPNRPAAQGKYARSTAIAQNVRAYDVNGRARGGSRPGIEKYISTRPGDTEYVTQHLTKMVITGATLVQPSQAGRQVLLVAVSQGNVYTCPAGGNLWTTATNNTGEDPPLNATGVMQSAQCDQKLFFADGINWCYYDPITDSVETWVATDGSLPEDSENNTPRLICLWRGRIVLSGILLLPSLIVMTKVSDPFNFDDNPPIPIPPDSAWDGRTGPQGLMGDVVCTLIPYTDDQLVVGMDSTMAVFRGDPLAGGQIDNITTTIGMAFGEPWCMDPSGNIYFFSNRTGVFVFKPGQIPQRISQAVDSLLLGINTGEYGVRLIWNDRFKGLHVFVTLLAEEFPTTHYFYEAAANAWWQDVFANTAHNPLCCVVFDGNEQQDRVALIGSWDGYVRSISSTAETDDGEDIDSEVFIGPFLTQYSDAVLLKELQPVMALNSGDVNYAVYVDDTAEEALLASPVTTGTWTEGRNFTDTPRRAGYAAYVQLTSAVKWAMESIRCVVDTRGSIRQRGK